jgi:23S rRNA pseudouridine1911/1915/1917 synthase
LLNVLVARQTAVAGGPHGRPGIVHRLDKDTSGLMMLAKTDAVHRTLQTAISRRQVTRVYAALVWGHIAESLTIDAPIARHPRERQRMAVLASGRAAVTMVDPVATFAVCDLVRVRLETGRTHQIRVHLSHVGHPVVGDPVYGGGGARRMTGAQKTSATALERVVGRQALHAALLGFRHPVSGQPVEFRAPWPRDLEPALAALGEDPALLARHTVLDYLGFFK